MQRIGSSGLAVVDISTPSSPTFTMLACSVVELQLHLLALTLTLIVIEDEGVNELKMQFSAA